MVRVWKASEEDDSELVLHFPCQCFTYIYEVFEVILLDITPVDLQGLFELLHILLNC